MRPACWNAKLEYMARTSQGIGPRIVDHRERRGWTQKQLAAKSGLNQSQVSRFEKGERPPSVEHLAAIAKALGCGVAELLPKDRSSTAA